MKIRPLVAELYHADSRMDGRTDRHDEDNSRFASFSNAPNRACRNMKSINTFHRQMQNFLTYNFMVSKYKKSKFSI
jgi:hypothetical protein